MFDVKINTPDGSIRMNLDGLMIRQLDTYVYLTHQEYLWLPVYHRRGGDLTVTSEGGAITLLPHIADALISLIEGLVSSSKSIS